MVKAQASIEVFSGRYAPKWTLTGDEVGELVGMLAELQPGGPLPPSGLGYRGVRVRLSGHPSVSMVRAWQGVVVQDPGGVTLTDDDRRLERWLWGSAKRHLPPDTMRAVEAHVPPEP
jgi:hypothetical protein